MCGHLARRLDRKWAKNEDSVGIGGSLGRVVEHFSGEGRDGAKKERYHLSPMTCTGAAFNSPVPVWRTHGTLV